MVLGGGGGDSRGAGGGGGEREDAISFVLVVASISALALYASSLIWAVSLVGLLMDMPGVEASSSSMTGGHCGPGDGWGIGGGGGENNG